MHVPPNDRTVSETLQKEYHKNHVYALRSSTKKAQLLNSEWRQEFLVLKSSLKISRNTLKVMDRHVALYVLLLSTLKNRQNRVNKNSDSNDSTIRK